MTLLVERQTGDRRVASFRLTRVTVFVLEHDTLSLLGTGHITGIQELVPA